jgi:eukaryotic-like serine/threonine-protein kinase
MIESGVPGMRDARTACFAEGTVVQLVEDKLDADASGPIHEHMAACDDCRRLVAHVARSLAVEHEVDADGSLPGAASPRLFPLGTVLGRYELLERIGAGGTGVIYRARDPQLERDVAVKLLRPDLTHTATNARSRLLREAQAMARLAHPNVVSVFDAGILDGHVFVAMELVDGQTLKQWLRSEQRSVQDVLQMFAATARGLEAAHAAGLVHRDFKPTNVLVGRDGRPRVTDFGLARAVALEVAGPATAGGSEHALVGSGPLEYTMTLTGTLLGTPAYMAPEQFLGAPTDARTDQFSFCIALYEALCGQRPFAGETLEQIAVEVTGGKLRAPPTGLVPPSVAAALLRGLEQDAAERFPSISALIAALSEEPPLPARPQRVRRRAILIALAAASALGIAVFSLAPTPPPPLLMTALDTLKPVQLAELSPTPPPSSAGSAPATVQQVRPKAAPRGPRRASSVAGPAKPAPTNPELIRDPWSPP